MMELWLVGLEWPGGVHPSPSPQPSPARGEGVLVQAMARVKTSGSWSRTWSTMPYSNGSFGVHPVVAVGIAGYFVKGLVAVFGKDGVQAFAEAQNFLGSNFDVGGGALDAAHDLVDQHGGVAGAVALALSAAR